jgi:hypothetical protein
MVNAAGAATTAIVLGSRASAPGWWQLKVAPLGSCRPWQVLGSADFFRGAQQHTASRHAHASTTSLTKGSTLGAAMTVALRPARMRGRITGTIRLPRGGTIPP